jgi:hypothetical protein
MRRQVELLVRHQRILKEFGLIYSHQHLQANFLHQRQNTVNPFNDGYKLLVQAVICEIRNSM